MSMDFFLYMPGEEFLVCYALILCICVLGAVLWRFYYDSEIGAIVAFLVFEVIGGVKLYSAMSRGLHNVSHLVLMMIVGGIVMFVKHLDGNGRSNGGSCSSYLSSCGGSSCGGGCGGGGCGGCGG